MSVFTVLWLTQVGYFILSFPWLIFLVRCFFANYGHLLSFLKNQKIIMSLTFALILICFTTSIMMKILARVTWNQFPSQKLFKFLMQKSFVSHWHVLKLSYTHIFCSKSKNIYIYIKSDRSIGFFEVFWEKVIFLQKLSFDNIGTNLLAVTSFYFS